MDTFDRFCCCSWLSEGKPANIFTPATLWGVIISRRPQLRQRAATFRIEKDVVPAIITLPGARMRPNTILRR